MCFYLFSDAYYNKNFNTSSSALNERTTIPSTTKFMDSKSTTANMIETSPRNTLLTKNTTRISHKKRNTSTPVIPYPETEFIAVPGSIDNSKPSVAAFHDSSTDSVKFKTKERNLKQNLFNILTKKIVELNAGTKSSESKHEMRHNLQTEKVFQEHIKYSRNI